MTENMEGWRWVAVCIDGGEVGHWERFASRALAEAACVGISMVNLDDLRGRVFDLEAAELDDRDNESEGLLHRLFTEMDEPMRRYHAARRAGLQAPTYYSRTPDGCEEHGSPEEARGAAESALEDGSDGWPEGIGSTEWGLLVPHEQAEQYDRREPNEEEAEEFSYMCKYRLVPAKGVAR